MTPNIMLNKYAIGKPVGGSHRFDYSGEARLSSSQTGKQGGANLYP